jgi:hypothetical protein
VVQFVFRRRLAATFVALLTAIGCAAGTPPLPVQPTSVPAQNLQLTVPTNNPPRVTALTIGTDRVEVGEAVTITATVLDDETPVDELTYRWDAVSGRIEGTGRIVKWLAPIGVPTPAAYRISLTVIDKYGLGEQSLEHRVTAESAEIHVNDSPTEVRLLSEEFIRDFANSSLSPQFCVRNFSDSCRGKQSEVADIVDNRKRFQILSHTFTVSRVTVNAGRTQSEVRGACEFRSTVKATGLLETARGTCVLSLTNQNYRWWLCDSRMTDANSFGLTFPF